MSSGYSSYKGNAAKPNNNMNGEINADPNIPQNLLTDEGYPFDERGEVNSEAIENLSNLSEPQHDDR